MLEGFEIFISVKQFLHVRSRINWYENGEKNSKYFLNLETTRSSKTAVRRLFDSKGKITVNPQAIMNELKSY